ncbi:MAG: lipopolysaccharide transport system ATP-binding protein [Acidobacteriota bacterium]|nr:lipopolysaccharide transport system ATP-binding protein [Acidobacteriota bacterium]
MDNNTAIKVEGLGKRYRIGAKQESYRTLRETLTETAAAPFRAIGSTLRRAKGDGRPRRANEIWALKDVSFDVKRGEAVGVIGSNGAGKSTLLKVLSRITEPTAGYADIEGRVGSLLEVGTGFHPELSGRENVYLNGAILGMKKVEIARKFDEIVAFAEVERFIDTPVKHYSSGMYLRLAFSVAAHLEPEILLVDEVLAVGDMAFQKKCLVKMEDVAAEGRTVLFVSHNLGAVKELCQRAVVLKDGAVVFHGSAVEGVTHYSRDAQARDADEVQALRGTRWREVRVEGASTTTTPEVAGVEPFHVEARLEVQDTFVEARLKCRLDDAAGNTLVYHVTNNRELESGELSEGLYRVGVEVPALWLKPGIYTIFFKLTGRRASGEEKRYTSERVMLNVTGRLSNHGQDRAVLAPPLRWSLARERAAGAS